MGLVTDPEVKRTVAGWYREGWDRAYGRRRDEILNAPESAGGALSPRSFLAAEHLANNLEHAPVWIFPVLRNAAEASNPRVGSSIYGAVQHLILAARAYGLGTTLTSLYMGHEDELRVLLGLPEDALTMALLPLGYPERGRWSQPKRHPLEQVVHWERWAEQREKPATA